MAVAKEAFSLQVAVSLPKTPSAGGWLGCAFGRVADVDEPSGSCEFVTDADEPSGSRQ